MNPSRALYMISGGLICGGATVQAACLLLAALCLILAIVFDHNNL